MRTITKLFSSALVFALGMSLNINVKNETDNYTSDLAIVVDFQLAKEAQAALCSTQERFLKYCCPRPCPVLDNSKLTQVVAQVSEETSKVTEYISQMKQWQQVLSSIGLNIGDLKGLLSMFQGGGSIPSLSMLTEGVNQAIPQAMQGVNLESIPDIQTKASNLYHSPNPSPEMQAQRYQFGKSSVDSSFATSLDVQSKAEKQQEKIKDLAEAAGKSKTRREDWAANSAAKLAVMEAMHDMSKLEGAFFQMASLLEMTSIGSLPSSAGSFSSSKTPFTIDTSKLPQSEGPMALDPNATALSQAAKKINEAVTIHNQAVAVKEMLDGYATAQQMRDTWAHYESQATQAYASFISAMGSAYTNPATSGGAIYNASTSYASGPYSDMLVLAPQLNSIQFQMMAYLKQNAEYYGTLLCMYSGGGSGGGGGGGGGGNSQTDCKQNSRDNASEAASSLYNVIFTRKQADWYYQFEVQGAELQEQISEQIQLSNEFVGMDLTNLQQVSAVLNNLIFEATQIAPESVLNAFVNGTANYRTAQNIVHSIAEIQADTGFNYYIAYDNNTGNVETGSLIDYQTPTGTENDPVEPDTDFIPGAE